MNAKQMALDALKELICDHGGSRAVSGDDRRAVNARAAIAALEADLVQLYCVEPQARTAIANATGSKP